MGRLDAYHNTVRQALQADGWTITHDPYPLKFGLRNVFVDLGAEAPLGAERAGRKIAVEVKSFLGGSDVTELERALGQYTLYGFLLGETDPDRALFLALPTRAFDTLFASADALRLIEARGLRLLIYDIEGASVNRWIEPDSPAS